ncbi:MAG: hypothetical protein BroJett007_34060 [Chloroflexota bacterium]|nr:MAG: hypothetical protein BroJett007_34060 [Chloroflexota bacterium]
MSDQHNTSSFSWVGLLKALGVATAIYLGGATGSFVSMEQMRRDDAEFKYDVRQELRQITKRLDRLEDAEERRR